ncbi:MAG: type II and III secretion system protein family protein [Acidobacteria bacterium]|nr:type II and III secretion system protein family protein [Acidobacteriota bacterium]
MHGQFRRLATFGLALAFTAVGRAQAPAPQAAGSRVVLTAGRSVVLATPFDVTRIAVTNPAVADAVVVQPREILVDGKAAGTVSLIVWGGTQRAEYDVIVDPGVSPLQQQLNLIFPGEDIRANQTADAVILTGRVSNTSVMLRAGEVAEAVAPKSKVLNMLQLPSPIDSAQVMLQVRVAEVNRRALTELGVSLFTGATGYKDYIARSTTQQFSAPGFENLQRTTTDGEVTNLSGDLTFSDFLNLFVMNTKYNVGALIKALQTSGHFQSLAEPNLIAYNGQEASFLAGGEVPIPVVQGVAGSISVQYKEFGIRLVFRPTIAGDVIRLRVAPEVSTLDFTNGLSLGGYRIPAITTRRAATDVELRDGQSFAIAGLMNNLAQDTRQAVPWLSKVPILGTFFKSKATAQEQTELMVIVTPHLVRALNPDEVPPLPTSMDRFMPEVGAPAPSR